MDNPEKLSRKNKVYVLVVFIGILFVGIFVAVYKTQMENRPPDSFIMNIDAGQLYQLINESCACMPIIDLRTPAEYATGHLNNTYNIDYRSASFMSTMQSFDKTSPIVIYCKGGSRSANASVDLRDDGFKYIYNLIGGIDAWRAQGYPIVITGIE